MKPDLANRLKWINMMKKRYPDYTFYTDMKDFIDTRTHSLGRNLKDIVIAPEKAKYALITHKGCCDKSVIFDSWMLYSPTCGVSRLLSTAKLGEDKITAYQYSVLPELGETFVCDLEHEDVRICDITRIVDGFRKIAEKIRVIREKVGLSDEEIDMIDRKIIEASVLAKKEIRSRLNNT